jgi:hypothetical protein
LISPEIVFDQQTLVFFGAVFFVQVVNDQTDDGQARAEDETRKHVSSFSLVVVPIDVFYPVRAGLAIFLAV